MIIDNFLESFINYCEQTNESDWCMYVVKNVDNRNCLFGHLVDFALSINGKPKEYWEYFEDNYANTYLIYPVNDGENPIYQQKTPKQRCIQYLKNLQNGSQKTIHQLVDEDYAKYLESKTINMD